MNFIDAAFAQHLQGDDFLQAMADIYDQPAVREILCRYPRFVTDVILLIDYDSALAMDGLDEILCGSLSAQFPALLAALNRCGATDEAAVLQKAQALYNADARQYRAAYDTLYGAMALNGDYDAFWARVRAYIDRSLADTAPSALG